jgi:hypothetical protein
MLRIVKIIIICFLIYLVVRSMNKNSVYTEYFYDVKLNGYGYTLKNNS